MVGSSNIKFTYSLYLQELLLYQARFISFNRFIDFLINNFNISLTEYSNTKWLSQTLNISGFTFQYGTQMSMGPMFLKIKTISLLSVTRGQVCYKFRDYRLIKPFIDKN